MHLFSADAIVFSKKVMKTWKNHPQKLLIIGPQSFLCTCLAAQSSPETEILYHQKLGLWYKYISNTVPNCTKRVIGVFYIKKDQTPSQYFIYCNQIITFSYGQSLFEVEISIESKQLQKCFDPIVESWWYLRH